MRHADSPRQYLCANHLELSSAFLSQKKAKAPKATIGKKKTPTRVLKSQPVKKAVDAAVVAAIDAAIAANGDEPSDESGAALVGKAVRSLLMYPCRLRVNF